MRTYADIAQIIGRKGLDGKMLIEARSYFPAGFDAIGEGLVGKTFHFVPPLLDGPRHAVLSEMSVQSADRALARFEGIGDAGTAESLVGCHCLVEDDGFLQSYIPALVSLDDAISFDNPETASLIHEDAFDGWSLRDLSSGDVYRIDGFEMPSSQIILHVSHHGEDEGCFLVPLADDLVEGLSVDERMLSMRLPNGIMDI